MISKHGIKPVKSLGQNFLIDNNTIEKIVDSAQITKNDLIIEIGPGTGTLTKNIAKRAGSLVAVEIDKKLIPLLDELLKEYSNTEIINKDILKTDVKSEILDRHVDYNSYKVIANLPYYITTPIIMKFIKSKYPPSQLTVMLQKEVADRINAKPGGKEYGSLSVVVGYYCNVCKIMSVSPNCFYPKPKVTSTVLQLTMRESKKVSPVDEKLFFTIIKSAFAQRRKKVSNSIANASGLDVSRKEIEDVLQKLGIPVDIRAERLSVENFAEITELVKRILS